MKILATVLCLCIAAGAVFAQDTIQVKEYPHLYLLAGSLVGAIAFTRAWDKMDEYNDLVKTYEKLDDDSKADLAQADRDLARMIMVLSGIATAAFTYSALHPKTHHINLTMSGDLAAPKLCLSYRF